MKGRALRALLVERDGPHCYWCRRLTVDPLQVGDTADEAATVDHLDTRQGSRSARDPSRAVVACYRCNHDRGSLTVDEWRAVLEVRKASAPSRFGALGFYVVLGMAVLWWLPTIAWALVKVGAGWVELWWLVRRARRLRLAGRLHEAMAVLEHAEDRARARTRRGGRRA